jgi:hypothetical protein
MFFHGDIVLPPPYSPSSSFKNMPKIFWLEREEKVRGAGAPLRKLLLGFQILITLCIFILNIWK